MNDPNTLLKDLVPYQIKLMLNLNQGLSIHKDLHENSNEAFQTFD